MSYSIRLVVVWPCYHTVQNHCCCWRIACANAYTIRMCTLWWLQSCGGWFGRSMWNFMIAPVKWFGVKESCSHGSTQKISGAVIESNIKTYQKQWLLMTKILQWLQCIQKLVFLDRKHVSESVQSIIMQLQCALVISILLKQLASWCWCEVTSGHFETSGTRHD